MDTITYVGLLNVAYPTSRMVAVHSKATSCQSMGDGGRIAHARNARTRAGVLGSFLGSTRLPLLRLLGPHADARPILHRSPVKYFS
jgi:hypothetical protein